MYFSSSRFTFSLVLKFPPPRSAGASSCGVWGLDWPVEGSEGFTCHDGRSGPAMPLSCSRPGSGHQPCSPRKALFGGRLFLLVGHGTSGPWSALGVSLVCACLSTQAFSVDRWEMHVSASGPVEKTPRGFVLRPPGPAQGYRLSHRHFLPHMSGCPSTSTVLVPRNTGLVDSSATW